MTHTTPVPRQMRGIPAFSRSAHPEDYDRDGRYLYPGDVEETMPEGELAWWLACYVKQAILARIDRARETVHAHMPIYYRQGTRKLVAPDVMVIPGVPYDRRRKSYRLWETGIPPRVVFEFISERNEDKDRVTNRARYEELGIEEYYLFDPDLDTLEALVLDRRTGGYREAACDSRGRFASRALGLRIGLEKGLLALYDERGRYIVPVDERVREESKKLEEESRKRREESRKRREESRKRREESRKRQAAERRVEELEAELAKLRRPRGGGKKP